MPITAKDIKLIDDFLAGRLDAKGKVEFQQRRLDPEFEAELDFYQSLKNTQVDAGRSHLRSAFEEWDREQPKVPSHRKIRTAWAIAATAVILIGIGLMIFVRPEPTLDNLYATYYQSYPNLIDPLQKGDSNDAVSISQYYELENYENALALTPDSIQLFYAGLSFLATDQIDRATSCFEVIVVEEAHRFQKAAQWYLALSYLRNEELNKARSILETIESDPNHDFQHEAGKLASILKKQAE